MSARAKSNLADTLATITRHAPELRKAGVLAIVVGDVQAQLAPHIPEGATERGAGEVPYSGDPLNDPDTYGSSGIVPGFKRDDDPNLD